MWNLKHREQLLSDLAAKTRTRTERLINIRVRLTHKQLVIKEFLGFGAALDALVNDLYWDEEGNWSEADGLLIDTY